MNLWGERYAEVDHFISYCRDQNVKTNRRELEHYEKIGVMQPVARVEYPTEYVMQTHQSSWKGAVDLDAYVKWPALGKLREVFGPGMRDEKSFTEEELIHCFDREMEAGNNPHLIKPSLSEFRPWSDYRIGVMDNAGDEVMRPTADHYYSYWQVHQLSLIQQYPDLYENAWLIRRIPKDDPKRRFLPRAINNDLLIDFKGMRSSFDALSFWITGYDRERNRTFATVTDHDGVKTLNQAQAAAHRKRLVAFSKKVVKRFQFSIEDLYNFLRRLIHLMECYVRNERNKLAVAIKGDISAWGNLLMLVTGKTRDDIAEELGKVNVTDERAYRHLDIAAKERDYTIEHLRYVSKRCCTYLNQFVGVPWSCTEQDISELLDYCEDNGLGLLMTSLSGMVAIGDEEHRRNFRRVQMYINLKNVLNAYEYLLKSLPKGASLPSGTETLTPLVSKIMGQEAWYPLFDSRMQKGLLKGSNVQDFLINLRSLQADFQLQVSSEGYWAQNFLITCLARNMTVHSYPSEDSYYGSLFGLMLEAVSMVILYTWLHAKAKNWT